MSATNPFRVSDLIAKYGWKIMPYLSNLGPQLLAEAQVLFVDSGHTDATDADDTEHGHSFEKPLATLDYAIGLCEASEGAVILLAPGHVEAYDDTTTGFDADVVGIVIIGIGIGSSRPRFDFTDSTSKCVMGANDVQIKNVVFRPFTPTVAIGLDYDDGVTGVILEDVEFAMGEAGNGDDEFVKAVHLTDNNHDSKFKNVKIFAHASAGSATHGIHVDAASDRLIFDNVIIDGPYATGGIVEDETGVNHIVENCAIDTSGTNYSFDGSSTFAKRVNNVDGQVREDDSESLIVEDRGSAAYPSGITNESIWAYLLSKSSTPAASSYDNETDSLEAIADAVGAIGSPTDVTGAVPEPPTAKSLQDILHKDGSFTYSKTSDSLEAIGTDTDAIIVDIATAQTELDKIGTISNAGGTATLGAALGPFANSTLVARLDIITADTAAIEPGAKRLVSAITTDWNVAADNDMFTVSGLVKAKIWGEVLVIVKNTTMLLQVIATATSPGSAPIDVTANLDCDQDAAGTVYKLATTIGGAMVATTGGVSADDGIEVIIPAGVIELGSGANEDGGGSIQWFCQYEPLEAGATVTAT